jgi:3-phosphoshikimate 1-carboxyvinyltransferase
MARVTTPLAAMGADIETTNGGAPILIRGTELHGASHRLEIASAQVKSAILLAGLSAAGCTSVAEPVLSRDHTERMLVAMGTRVDRQGLSVSVDGPSIPNCIDVDLCGDPSSAAFIVVAALLTPGSEVSVEKVCINPSRTGFVDILRRMGADIEILDRDECPAEPFANIRAAGSKLLATAIGPADVPASIDELPVIAVAAAFADGVTKISGASELRVKESDRISTVIAMLSLLGAQVSERPDGMEIHGSRSLAGGVLVDAGGDHRLAMAAAVAALRCRAPVTIEGAGSVDVSYPGFFEQLEALRT